MIQSFSKLFKGNLILIFWDQVGKEVLFKVVFCESMDESKVISKFLELSRGMRVLASLVTLNGVVVSKKSPNGRAANIKKIIKYFLLDCESKSKLPWGK